MAFTLFGLRKAKTAAADPGLTQEEIDAEAAAEEERKRKEEEERKRKAKAPKGYFGEGTARGKIMQQIQDDEE